MSAVMINATDPAGHHTPGPWHTCREGKCSCFTVMSDHHPVAQITHGDWGDEYPAIRLVGPSLDQRAEAYMEQITYGSVGDAAARANWRLIAAAPDLLEALKSLLSARGKRRADAIDQAQRAIAKAECGIAQAAATGGERT